jgi:hypothetical protein
MHKTRKDKKGTPDCQRQGRHNKQQGERTTTKNAFKVWPLQ